MDSPYTNKEIRKLPKNVWPERGQMCEKCGYRIPSFADMSPEREAAIRKLKNTSRIAAIKAVVDETGCGLNWAQLWVIHPEDHLRSYPKDDGPSCPYCDKNIRTDKAKQCFHCGMDWHNPDAVLCHKSSDKEANPS